MLRQYSELFITFHIFCLYFNWNLKSKLCSIFNALHSLSIRSILFLFLFSWYLYSPFPHGLSSSWVRCCFVYPCFNHKSVFEVSLTIEHSPLVYNLVIGESLCTIECLFLHKNCSLMQNLVLLCPWLVHRYCTILFKFLASLFHVNLETYNLMCFGNH